MAKSCRVHVNKASEKAWQKRLRSDFFQSDETLDEYHFFHIEMPLAAAASSSHATSTPPLLSSLLLRWAEGQLQATDVQSLCMDAKLSGLEHPEIASVAACGNSGTCPQNTHRDLSRRYCADMAIPEPFQLTVPCFRHSDHKTLSSTQISVLLPHEWFACVAKDYTDRLDELFGLSRCRRFWNAQSSDNAKFHNHPMTETVGWQGCFFPYVLHADGAAYQKRDSLKILSMRSLLQDTSQDGSHERHLLLACFASSVEAEATWEVLANYALVYGCAFRREIP